MNLLKISTLIIFSLCLPTLFSKYVFTYNTTSFRYTGYTLKNFALSSSPIYSNYFGRLINIVFATSQGYLMVANTENNSYNTFNPPCPLTQNIKWISKYLFIQCNNRSVQALDTTTFQSIFNLNLNQSGDNFLRIQFGYSKFTRSFLTAVLFSNRVQVYENSTLFINTSTPYNIYPYSTCVMKFSPSYTHLYYSYRGQNDYRYYWNELNLQTKSLYYYGQSKQIVSIAVYNQQYQGNQIIVSLQQQQSDYYGTSQIWIHNNNSASQTNLTNLTYLGEISFTNDYRYFVAYKKIHQEKGSVKIFQANNQPNSQNKCCNWMDIQINQNINKYYSQRIVKIDGYGDKIIVLKTTDQLNIYSKVEIIQKQPNSKWNWAAVVMIGGIAVAVFLFAYTCFDHKRKEKKKKKIQKYTVYNQDLVSIAPQIVAEINQGKMINQKNILQEKLLSDQNLDEMMAKKRLRI